MASNHCPREADTIRAAWGEGKAGPSPQGVDPPLAAHLAECPGCAEIAALAQAFRDQRGAACAAAHPPSAGVVWWRAQRRAREEAARRAAGPITFVHGIALGCAGAAVVALLGLGLGIIPARLAAWGRAVSWPALPSAGAFDLLSGVPFGLLLVAAAALLLAPVAIYLALER